MTVTLMTSSQIFITMLCSGPVCQNESTGQMLSLCITQLQHRVSSSLISSENNETWSGGKSRWTEKSWRQIVKSRQHCIGRSYDTEMDVCIKFTFWSKVHTKHFKIGSSTPSNEIIYYLHTMVDEVLILYLKGNSLFYTWISVYSLGQVLYSYNMSPGPERLWEGLSWKYSTESQRYRLWHMEY